MILSVTLSQVVALQRESTSVSGGQLEYIGDSDQSIRRGGGSHAREWPPPVEVGEKGP